MIEHIDIIALSHYDLGFTDHPAVCRQLQSRFLDQALDLAADPAREFRWTVESNHAVLEWWQTASPARRNRFVEQVHAGRIEVCAAPFNHGPTMDARQWRCFVRWLPETLRQAFRPRTLMQNDVNGFPRAGIMAFLDTGVEFLWMGLNADTGGSPAPQPSARWWEMPDGRRIFVWHAESYPNGYFLFETDEWRRGPLPTAADTRYRPPRSGDILVPTPENLERAHAVCRAKIAAWQKQGFPFQRVAVSLTNMWRIDNDPPCAALSAFIAAWNAANLKPRLALTTPAQALAPLRAEGGDRLPVMRGDWPNWWANGVASTPRELAASRRAKRLLDALDAPFYQDRPDIAPVRESCTRDLCFFDEHTWGSWNSSAQPDSLDSRGQFAEKAGFAYRPLALAELAIGDANRALTLGRPGIQVVNPYPAPFTGWITLTDDCLRGEYAGVRAESTGVESAFVRSPGVSAFFTRPTAADQFSARDTARVFPDRIPGKTLRFWVTALPPASITAFALIRQVTPGPVPVAPKVDVDPSGWPISATWADGTLFQAGLGDFNALEFEGLAPRWTYKEVLGQADPAARRAARDRQSRLTRATPRGAARVTDTGPTLRFEQELEHPRLRTLGRTLELHKLERRARLRIALDRLSKPASAEIFYIQLPLSVTDGVFHLQSAGVPFIPEQDQIPRSCRDYFAHDGRVVWRGTGGTETVIECLDTALVALGGIFDGLGLDRLPLDPPTVYALLYNNIWYTNFAGDEAGRMDFDFDLYQAPQPGAAVAPAVFAVVQG